MPSSRIRKKIIFWVLKGILVEIETDVFSPNISINSEQLQDMILAPIQNFDIDSGVQPDNFATCWIYIKGILSTNSMGLERIHSFLTLSQGYSSNDFMYISIAKLELLLDCKVKFKELSLSDGMYSLLFEK